MEVTKEHRDNLEKSILQAIIYGLENKHLVEDNLSDISEFVLERIDKIDTHDQLMVFLSDLSGKWPIFKHIAFVEKAETERNEDMQTVEKVEDLVEHGKIDEAIDLAKSANED